MIKTIIIIIQSNKIIKIMMCDYYCYYYLRVFPNKSYTITVHCVMKLQRLRSRICFWKQNNNDFETRVWNEQEKKKRKRKTEPWAFNDNEFRYSQRVIIYTWQKPNNVVACMREKRPRITYIGRVWQMIQKRLLAQVYIFLLITGS